MLRQFAEAPDRYTDLTPPAERYMDERMCVTQGPTWAAISDVRTDDLDAVIAKARELVPAEKKPVWWIGPSAEPADLYEQLQARGFGTPEDGTDWLYAMASSTAPPESPGIDVRRVETFDEFMGATQVAWDAFEISEERRERERPHLETMFEGRLPTFVAYLDGEAVGVGRSVYSDRGVFLIGGAVLEHARGRGVYRALVRARWDDAVARGTPGMIVEALPDTSYPILQRIGFEVVCTIRRLEDPR
jgi:GNAT superfamily N-acetyltransferase